MFGKLLSIVIYSLVTVTFFSFSVIYIPLLVIFGPEKIIIVFRIYAWLLVRVGLNRLVVTNPPPSNKGPYLLLCNHQSFFDVLVLSEVLPYCFSAIAKKELLSFPVFGFIMKRLGIVTIDRSSGRDSIGGINMAVEKLRSGMPVFTFPEGTRTKDGKVAKFKRGSFKLALESQASIVPIGISGSYEAPRRIGTIKINFGQPIEYDEYKHLSDIELADLIRQKVIELSFQKKESNHGTV